MDALLLARPSLTARLDRALEHRLTAVVAGPGSGKSTVLRAWYSGVRAAVWHPQPTGSWASAASGLVEALSAVVELPDLSASWRSAAPEPESPARRGAAMAGDLVDAIGDTELVLVVDELDPVGDVPGVRHLLTSLVRQAPPTLHVVVASGSALPPDLAALCGLELTGDDLAFDLPAIEAMLQAVGGDAQRAPEILGATGGWALGVRLAAEADPSIPAEVRPLVHRALEQRSAAARAVLQAAVDLPWVDDRMLRHLGVADAGRGLEELQRHGVFLTPVGGNGHRLSDLVGDIVAAATGESPSNRTRRLRTAAEWLEGNGQPAPALACLVRAADHERLVAMLEANGTQLLRSGRVDVVADACTAVPPEQRTSLLHILEGDAHQVRGDWTASLAAYLRASQDADPGIRPKLAWRIGLIHYLRGELEEAMAAYERGFPITGERPSGAGDGAGLGDIALARAWGAAACWLRGDLPRARQLATDALQDALASAEPGAEAAARTALAMVAAADGDRAANDAHYRAALAAAERAGDALQLIRIHTNRASHFCEEGAFDAALRELEKAIHLSGLAGERTMRSMALSNRAEVHHRLGRMEEAAADVTEAERICTEVDTDMVVYPLLRRGLLAGDRGDRPAALSALGRAIEIARRTDDRQVLAPALAARAVVLAIEDPTAAEALAREAVTVSGGLARAEALIARAAVALHRHDPAEATRLALQALADARHRRDRVNEAEALHVLAAADRTSGARHVRAARAIWAGLGCPIGVAATTLLAADIGSPASTEAEARLVGMGAAGLAERIRAWRSDGVHDAGTEDVRLRVLGGLTLELDGVPVPHETWGSRKSRLLLAQLVARRGRPVPREELAVSLWPDGDPSRLGPRLSVELSKLRRALGPARDAIVADRDSLHLDPDGLDVDVWRFVDDATAGLDAARSGADGSESLRRADAAYTGDFLEEHPYEPWAAGLRDRARALAANVARTLATTAWAAGDAAEAARCWRRVLERDAFAEDAHLALVEVLSAVGTHGEARRAYQTYVARMDEIDAPVRPFPTSEGGGPT